MGDLKSVNVIEVDQGRTHVGFRGGAINHLYSANSRLTASANTRMLNRW